VIVMPVALAAAMPPGQAAENESARARTPAAGKGDSEYRAALDVLRRSSDTAKLAAALKTLGDGYPESRPALVESISKESPRVRALAIKVLGQEGEAEKDLPLITRALADRHRRVRLAAVMALERFLPASFEDLVHHIPNEKEPNNRKMAIVVLERWGNGKAIPYLVRWLELEEDAGVRKFCTRALETLTGEKLGDSARAWRDYLEARRLREAARKARAAASKNAATERP
jgi:HEAT repeat protein